MKSVIRKDFSAFHLKLQGVFPFALAVLAFVVGSPHPAFAAAVGETLGDMLCSLTANIMPNAAGIGHHGLGDLINGIAYIAGGITIGSGLLLLVRHYDSRDTPFHQPIARMIGGAGLLSLPAMVKWLLTSLFLNTGPAGIASVTGVCSGALAGSDAAVVAATAASVPLDVMLQNLVVSIKDPLTLLLSILSVIIGMIFIFRGLVKASRYGTDPRAYSVSNILSHLIVGAALVSVGASADAILGTLFGVGGTMSSSAFWTTFNGGAFVAASGFTAAQLASFEAAVGAALTFFQLIGFIAFIRGWMILKNYAESGGQASAAQGLTHVLGGAMAINIYQVLTILDSTFGTGFL